MCKIDTLCANEFRALIITAHSPDVCLEEAQVFCVLIEKGPKKLSCLRVNPLAIPCIRVHQLFVGVRLLRGPSCVRGE
jgi:hypothetical protein